MNLKDDMWKSLANNFAAKVILQDEEYKEQEKHFWDFTAEDVISRAIECLTEKDMKEVKNSKGIIKKKPLTRFEIDEKYHNYQYPISLSAWDSYKKTLSKKAKTGTSAMSLESLYKICIYTNVSADYFLGLSPTKRKEQSAEVAQRIYGLNDESLDIILDIKNNIKRFQRFQGLQHHRLINRYVKIDGSAFLNFVIKHFIVDFAKRVDDYFKIYARGKKNLAKYENDETHYSRSQECLEMEIIECKYEFLKLINNFLDLFEKEMLNNTSEE